MKNKKVLFIIILIIVIGGVVFIKEVIPILNKNQSKNMECNDMIGKWQTVSAVNTETGEKTTNLKDVFGSSYQKYGSYLELNKDGTFNDAIEPITDGSKSNTGKYTIKKDYNKIGDCYIILSYSDQNEEKLQRIFLDDNNTAYLVLDNIINGYQLFLKK